MRRLLATAVAMVTVLGGRAAPADSPPADEKGLLLRTRTLWRAHWTWRTPVLRGDDGRLATFVEREYGDDGFTCRTPPPPSRPGRPEPASAGEGPPAGWAAADFDDAAWTAWAGWPSGDRKSDYGSTRYGHGIRPTLALLCLRGKFAVSAPAKVRSLTLSLAYRGGAVVYLNGVEVARGHVARDNPSPDSDSPLLAVADDYPDAAFYLANGKPYDQKLGPLPADRIGVRIRRVENVKVPVSALRKGVNVLAVEIHRAPYRRRLTGNHPQWNTCGLVDLSLRADADAGAAEANLGGRPAGVQVWNAPITMRPAADAVGDPFTPLGPVRITAARGGYFCGQVVVSSDQPIKGVAATAGDLTRDGGGVIPSANVAVAYWPGTCAESRGEGALIADTALLPTPPAEVAVRPFSHFPSAGAVMPIWLKVRVPADAAAGLYRGTLTLRGAGEKPTAVPVELNVIDWRMPEPKAFRTHTCLIPSDETLAIQYHVPLYSDAHFKLMEQTFELMGQAGVKHLYLPLIAQTNFGNSQSLVRWTPKAGGGYDHDFSVFDRTLDMALRHVNPDIVCLYVWDLYMGPKLGTGGGRLRIADAEGRNIVRQVNGPRVTTIDAAGAIGQLEGPPCREPAARDFWRPVFEKVRQRLKARGLDGRLMIGVTDDFTPDDDAVGLFTELLPGVKWVQHSHDPGFGIRGRPGVQMGYNAWVYCGLMPPPQPWTAARKAGWRQTGFRTGIFPRFIGPAIRHQMYPQSHLALHRFVSEGALLANQGGLGRVGMDFWPVLPARKGPRSLIARYPGTGWHQLNMNEATAAVLAPGPDGPVSTARFEMIREGIYACEARIFIEDALYRAMGDAALAGRLGPERIARLQRVLDERHEMVRAACLAAEIGGRVFTPFRWCEGEPWTGLDAKLYAAAADLQAAMAR